MKIARCFNALALVGSALAAGCGETGEHDAGGPIDGAKATSGSTDTTSDAAGSTDTAAATGTGGSQASAGGASGNAGGAETSGGSGGVSTASGGAGSTAGTEGAVAGSAGSGGSALGSGGTTSGATTQGGSSGASGDLDPYTWCDPDLGAADNPRCTFPGSTCGNPWCTAPCGDTSGPGDECPLPLTGDAERVCYFNGRNLLCDEGQTCPDGMECRGSTCNWSLTCGFVSDESELPAYRLTLLGSGFQAFEFVHARIFVASDTQSAVGKVQIRDGAFEWPRSNALVENAAADIVVYLDENANDACDAEEPAWHHVTAPVTEDTTVEFAAGSSGWEPLAMACVTPGGTDLTTPSPCPP